jgi:RNA 3'-terminal phosphate cyclase (ATP)
VNFALSSALLEGMSDTMLELDGSFGEGGGQILRTSLALSLITGRPFHLRNIRAGRSKPGLQPQHLAGVRAAASIGKAELRGASLGSSDLQFVPGPVQSGKYRFEIGTAGATGLLLHAIYLPLAVRGESPSELTLVGGTHVSTSPCYHFLDVTWRRYLQACGLSLSLRMLRPGFYPRGGGTVLVNIQPSPHLKGLRLRERGPIRATGFSAVAGLPENIARRQARRAIYRLKHAGLDVDIEEQTWDGGPGSVLAVELTTEQVPTLFFALGERGKPAEKVADEVVDQVVAYLHAAPALVDLHSADQIVLPLSLAEGPSQYSVAEVTLHLTTNIEVIRRFLEREIVVEGEEGRPGTVRIA